MEWQPVNYHADVPPPYVQQPGEAWDKAPDQVLHSYTAAHSPQEEELGEAFADIRHSLVAEHAHRHADDTYTDVVDDDREYVVFHREDTPQDSGKPFDHAVSWDHIFVSRPDGVLRSRVVAAHDTDTPRNIEDITYDIRRHRSIRDDIFTAIHGRAQTLATLYEDAAAFAEECGVDRALDAVETFHEIGPPLDGTWDTEQFSTRQIEHFHLDDKEIEWKYQEEHRAALQSIWDAGMRTVESLLRSNADT